MEERPANPVAPPPDRGMRRLLLMLSAPGVLFYLVFLAAPMVVLVVYSLGLRGPNGGYEAAFTFEQYANLSSRWAPFINTVRLGLVGTLLCLLVAYPMAYFMATRGGATRHCCWPWW